MTYMVQGGSRVAYVRVPAGGGNSIIFTGTQSNLTGVLRGRTAAIPATRPQRRRVREPWRKQKNKRNPNSLVQGTGYTIINDDVVDRLVKIPAAVSVVDGLRSATSVGVAVLNVAQRASLELDRGCGDTDGCDGEECCDEVSGEEHRC
jgi:hypothetical protein